MPRTLHERKSSGSVKKRRKSSDKKSITSSIKREETASSLKPVSEESSASALQLDVIVKPKISYQDELVLLFFNSMLDNIIDEWITVPDVPPTVCFCNVIETDNVITKDFKDLSPEDMQNMVVSDVQGSTISLTRKGKSSKSASSLKTPSKKFDSSSKLKKKKSHDRSLTDTNIRKGSRLSSDLRKSITGSGTNLSSIQPSNMSMDWFLNPPDENVIIKFKNGNYYKGPVSKKTMHGDGKFIWADGSIYEGEFIYGDATGKGTLQYPDLTFYDGNFCKSYLHGEGVLNISSTTMIYSGNWKAGEKHGAPAVVMANLPDHNFPLPVYTDYVWLHYTTSLNCLGEGWLFYGPGNWYQGEWFEDKRQGVGLRYYQTGEKYKGKWYQGEREGQGTIVWPNTDVYKGEWFNGLMHGHGNYTWNGFLNDTFTFPLENTYQGTWINGKRNGVGIMQFGTAGGAQLAGIWKDNQKHGAGVMLCGNGTVVERNPLFWSDKPIHLETQANDGYPVQSVCACDFDKTVDYINNSKSTLQLITEQIQTKTGSTNLDPAILESIAMNQNKSRSSGSITTLPPTITKRPNFYTGKEECSPLQIPIHTPPEQIIFSHYTNLVIEKYTAILYKAECTKKEPENTNICGGIKPAERFPSAVSKYSKWNILERSSGSPSKDSNNSRSTARTSTELESILAVHQQIQAQIEDTHLRNTITVQLPKLYYVYDKYATIASPRVLPFKPVLIRYFMWQMLRDLEIVNKTYTLLDLDKIIMENPQSGFESEHDPFEKIYFWQFLQILITLAWVLHSPSIVTEECKRFGMLSAIFTEFLTEVVYHKTEVTYSCSIFAYRDLLPIKNVYALYQKQDQPYTARKFLCNACTKKRELPPCYLKAYPDSETCKPVIGSNVVPVGGNIMFLPEDPPGVGVKPDEPYIVPPTDDPFRKELFILRSLGPKKVVQCLKEVCPYIASEGVIVNMEYPLLFIEFYETLLLCAFKIVDRDKKREERIRLREEALRLLSEQIDVASRSTIDSKLGRNKEKRRSKTMTKY